MTGLLLSVLCAPVAMSASELLADRSRPFQLEADSAEYSDVTQTARFTGRVVLTQGSMRIEAATIETLLDPEGYSFATAKSAAKSWVQFEQKRDGTNEIIRARAKQLLYDGKNNVIVLAGQARAQRFSAQGALLNEISAEELTYNQLTEIFETNVSERGRTHIVIVPESSKQPSSKSTRSNVPAQKATPRSLLKARP
jgi:lipopolysaccharide export system protein LptA